MNNPERDKPERPAETKEQHEGEAKLRKIERADQAKPERTPDRSFTDERSRPITIRNWESDKTLYARAYDTSKEAVPENINMSTTGLLNADIERHHGPNPRLCVRDVRIDNLDYRGAGVGRELIQRAEHYAQRNGVREIYGRVTDAEARSFWERQSEHGWNLVQKGEAWEVHKTL